MAARRPTCPTRRSDAIWCRRTASTTPSCAGATSSGSPSRCSTSVRWRRRRPAVPGRAAGFDLSFDPERDPVDTDEESMPPRPIADEMKLAAIEAVWNNGAWRETKWLGQPVARLPMDLYTYQELLHDVRPDFVVVTGDDSALGGRALFLASICDQLGHGRVVVAGVARSRPSTRACPHRPCRRRRRQSGGGGTGARADGYGAGGGGDPRARCSAARRGCVRALFPPRAGRVVRRRREHSCQRPSGRVRLRARAARGSGQHPRPAPGVPR